MTTVGRYPLSLPHNRRNAHPQKIAILFRGRAFSHGGFPVLLYPLAPGTPLA